MPVDLRTQRVRHIKRWWQGGYFRMDERLAAETDLVPKANSVHFYCKDDAGVSALFYRDDAGVEHELVGSGGGGGTLDHGVLTGLGDDDHPQYLLAAGTRALTGDWTTGAFNVIIGGGASANELRFLEPSGSGTNYTGFKAQTQAASLTYTLPAADATVSGYALTSNAAGILSWAAVGVSDHGALTGLGDDDHAQYALLAGRSGGQLLKGGTAVTDFLALQSTGGVGTTDYIKFLVGSNGATEAMRINHAGNVGIGTAIPTAKLDLYSGGVGSVTYYTTGFNGGFGNVYTGRHNGSSADSPADVVTGNYLGAFQFRGYAGGWNNAAYIACQADVVLGSSITSSFQFALNDSGAGVTELLRLNSKGNLGLGTTTFPTTGTKGLIFGDGTALATMASNTAGLYADSMGANVEMMSIDESSRVRSLAWPRCVKVGTQFDKVDATLANVTDLTHNVNAGKSYDFEALLHVDASLVGGSKFAIAGTATATSIIYHIDLLDNTTNAHTITSRQTALAGSAGQAGTTAGLCRIIGTIVVNAAGTLTVQMAQNAANGTSSVLVNSSFTVDQLP